MSLGADWAGAGSVRGSKRITVSAINSNRGKNLDVFNKMYASPLIGVTRWPRKLIGLTPDRLNHTER